MSRVNYELGFYNPEDVILYSHPRENFKSDKKEASFLSYVGAIWYPPLQ
jgi:hypothetical protein